MSRPHRVDYPGARHHVMNRGARRQPIYADAESCGTFLHLLGDLRDRYGIQVHAYALMPNHFHLLLTSENGRLSAGMKYLQGRFVQRNNERFDWDGPLFNGRFRNRVVEDDPYWRHLLAYVHLNPVRARLVNHPDQADWTSHAAYVGLEACPTWLARDELLDLHGGLDGYRGYLTDLMQGRLEPPEGFDENQLWSPGVVSLAPQHETSDGDSPAEYDPQAGLEARTEAALAEVGSVLALDRKRLLASRTGRSGNRVRWIVAWWLCWRGRLTGVQVARLLGVDTSVVSRARALAEARRESEPRLDEWMTRLEQGEGSST